jgi:hypothetical protein
MTNPTSVDIHPFPVLVTPQWRWRVGPSTVRVFPWPPRLCLGTVWATSIWKMVFDITQSWFRMELRSQCLYFDPIFCAPCDSISSCVILCVIFNLSTLRHERKKKEDVEYMYLLVFSISLMHDTDSCGVWNKYVRSITVLPTFYDDNHILLVHLN